MSTIKPGMLAFIKTTEEPVFVLTVEPVPADGETGIPKGVSLSGEVAMIRVPQQTDQGIRHRILMLFVEELETPDEHDQRLFETLEKRDNMVRGAAKARQMSLDFGSAVDKLTKN